MKASEFCYWLQGYFELETARGVATGKPLTPEQPRAARHPPERGRAMRTAIYLAALTLLACTSRDEATLSARRYMAALGVEGRLICSDGDPMADCTIADEAGNLTAIECDDEDCRVKVEVKKSNPHVQPHVQPHPVQVHN